MPINTYSGWWHYETYAIHGKAATDHSVTTVYSDIQQGPDSCFSGLETAGGLKDHPGDKRVKTKSSGRKS